MFTYQVISPIVVNIDGNSFKNAIKNFAKLYHNMNLAQIIITDQHRHMEAKLNYYIHDGRNKVGIDMYPINYPFVPIVQDNKISNINSPFMLNTLLSPVSPLSPVASVLPLNIINNL